jgi:hypothetical protein
MNDQEPHAEAGDAGSLQLDRAEYDQNAPDRCAACGQALGGSYYEVGRVDPAAPASGQSAGGRADRPRGPHLGLRRRPDAALPAARPRRRPPLTAHAAGAAPTRPPLP